ARLLGAELAQPASPQHAAARLLAWRAADEVSVADDVSRCSAGRYAPQPEFLGEPKPSPRVLWSAEQLGELKIKLPRASVGSDKDDERPVPPAFLTRRTVLGPVV